MLPTFVSNFFWGATNKNEEEQTEVKHTTSESGDWLVISTGTNSDSAEEEMEKVETESVASDYSWVVEPCPRFLTPSSTTSLLDHSMENLLIEHPTMSVYAGHSHQPKDEQQQQPSLTEHQQEAANQKQLVLVDRSKQQLVLRNQNRQVALRESRARQQLAEQLGIPLHKPPVVHEASAPSAAKEGRKHFNKHNNTNIRVTRGKKSFKIQKCGVKAGRRRC